MGLARCCLFLGLLERSVSVGASTTAASPTVKATTNNLTDATMAETNATTRATAVVTGTPATAPSELVVNTSSTTPANAHNGTSTVATPAMTTTVLVVHTLLTGELVLEVTACSEFVANPKVKDSMVAAIANAASMSNASGIAKSFGVNASRIDVTIACEMADWAKVRYTISVAKSRVEMVADILEFVSRESWTYKLNAALQQSGVTDTTVRVRSVWDPEDIFPDDSAGERYATLTRAGTALMLFSGFGLVAATPA